MSELTQRVVTGIVSGGLFLGIYFYFPVIFSFLLLALLGIILVFEWPLLVSPRTINFWLLTPLYPTVPVACLIYLNTYYRVHDILFPLYPFLMSWAHDSGAYFVGKSLGRHKLCPAISPKKTWEGLFGGLVSVLIVHMVLAHFRPGLGFSTCGACALIQSVFLVAAAFGGDFFVSFLKRRAQVKDTGTLLPGHGGLLDRFDSVFFVVIYVVLSLYIGI